MRGRRRGRVAMLDGHQPNTLLRSLLRAAIVARSGGRGARTPLADRAGVLATTPKLEVCGREGSPSGPEPHSGTRPVSAVFPVGRFRRDVERSGHGPTNGDRR
jgi:hypothetical protein